MCDPQSISHRGHKLRTGATAINPNQPYLPAGAAWGVGVPGTELNHLQCGSSCPSQERREKKKKRNLDTSCQPAAREIESNSSIKYLLK